MGRNKKNNPVLRSLAVVLAILAATAFSFAPSVLAAGAVPTGISYRDDTVFIADRGADVSIAVNNADIRDILSLFATKLRVNIVYVGNSFSTSFFISDVDASTAFEIFMKSTSVDGAGLSFVRDGDLLVVASANNLKNNFADMMVITSFKLNYMTPQDLTGYLSQLGVKVTSIILDDSTNRIFVQGFPYEIAKVNEIINMLDRAEYYTGSGPAFTVCRNLIAYKLKYISAASLENVMNILGIEADTFIMAANPETLWVSAEASVHDDVSQLIKKIDIVDNRSDNKFGIYRLKYIDIELVNKAMSELGLWATAEGGSGMVTVIPNTVLSKNPYVILVNFKYVDKEMVDFLIAQLDTPANLPEDPALFIYTFKNLSAQTGLDRIEFFGEMKAYDSSEVVFKEFIFPGLGEQIMVLCTKSEESAVRAFLAEIDKSGAKIIAVVDRAGGNITSRTRLEARIPMISYLSGVPEANMYVSGNVSKTETPQYVMWVEDTPENIEKVKAAIANLDSGI
ncbi:MAG: hypothetical protein R6W99_03040 [Clostridia bacterium]